MKRVISILVLAGAVVAATTPREPAHQPATAEHQRIASGGRPAAIRGGTPRQSCGLKSPLLVTVRALSTPLLGREVELEVSVSNGMEDGAIRTALRLPDGLDARAESSWTDSMTHGQTVRHRVTVRVNSGAPQPVTAKASSLDPAHQARIPGEAHTTLYPLEASPAGVRAHWSATTLRSLAEPEDTVVTLRNGDRAVLIRGDN